MVSNKNYIAGWLYGSIHELVKLFRPTSDDMAYALITSLDSDVAPGRLLSSSPDWASLMPTAKAVGEFIIVETKDLVRAEHQAPIFFGFDEVWFFPNDTIELKPISPWIVGPARIDDGKLKGLAGWMNKNDCACGFGDGEGINFVVKAPEGIARYIFGYSLAQVAPDAVTGIVASP
jgi:hypothetical protein